MASTGACGGGFALYDVGSGQVEIVGPFDEASDELWGSPDCVNPPGDSFSPHGIELSQRADGRWQVLAVNHGGRERVEWFEVIPASDYGDYRLVWRGCVFAPEGAVFNAIAAVPGSTGFVVTQLWETSNPGSRFLSTIEFVGAEFGMADGAVLRWDGDAFHVIPGTERSMPNGIAVSNDGKFFYVNMVLTEQLQKYAISGGEPVAVVPIEGGLDNMRWNSDRTRLLIAAIRAPMWEYMYCLGKVTGACPAQSAIIVVDPVSMGAEALLIHEGAPMGAFTVAVELENEYLIGSFSGDRLLRLPKSKVTEN